MRSRTSSALAALVGLVLSGCASNPSEKATKAAPDTLTSGLVNLVTSKARARTDARVTFADMGEPRSLDPAVTGSTGETGGTALASIFDTLTRYDVEKQEYLPHLAEEIAANDDHTLWTLTVREGVTFSDGQPFDAAAVRSSFERYVANHGADAGMISSTLASVTTPDARTVVFTMQRPWASFPAVLAQGAGMVVAPGTGTGAEFTAVGAGPFTLGSYRPAESLSLVANPDYWGGPVKIGEVVFKWAPEETARLDSLKAGEAQFAYLRNASLVRGALKDEVGGYLAITSGAKMLAVNNAAGRPGADANVRRAIAAAVDPAVLNERAMSGAALAGAAVFGANSRWQTEAAPAEADAAALVAEAKKAGFHGTLRYVSSGDPQSKAEAVTVQAALESVGFTVDLDFQASTADTFKKVYVDRDFDLASAGLSATEEFPAQRLTNFLSSTSARNIVGYRNPEVDALLVDLQEADSDGATQAALDGIQTIWDREAPSVVLAALPSLVAWGPSVQGVVPTAERMLLLGKAWVADE